MNIVQLKLKEWFHVVRCSINSINCGRLKHLPTQWWASVDFSSQFQNLAKLVVGTTGLNTDDAVLISIGMDELLLSPLAEAVDCTTFFIWSPWCTGWIIGVVGGVAIQLPSAWRMCEPAHGITSNKKNRTIILLTLQSKRNGRTGGVKMGKFQQWVRIASTFRYINAYHIRSDAKTAR